MSLFKMIALLVSIHSDSIATNVNLLSTNNLKTILKVHFNIQYVTEKSFFLSCAVFNTASGIWQLQ